MLERSGRERTIGRIAFRRTERVVATARRRAVPLPSALVDDTFGDPQRATRVRALAPVLDDLFGAALTELGAPGLAYGVALDGELVHSGGFGVRSLESGDAPGADT